MNEQEILEILAADEGPKDMWAWDRPWEELFVGITK